MARSQVQPGAIIDGFTIGECVHSGGMTTLWSVTRPDIAAPLLMKIPLVSEGEDPAAIVALAHVDLQCLACVRRVDQRKRPARKRPARQLYLCIKLECPTRH